MSTFTASDAFSITYTTQESTLQATFTASTPHDVEPALVAAWALLDARTLELKAAVFNLNGAKCIVEIDLTWSIAQLLKTVRTQLNAFGEDASSDVRCELTINAPEEQTCPISIQCTTPNTESVEITMRFDTERIAERMARLTASRYAHVLSQLLRGAAKKVSQLSTFSQEDWQVVSTLNPEAPALVHDTVHGMFTRQAQATPDSIAIESWDGKLTYTELDALSTQLACSLGEKQEFIAICFEKTRWSLVAILAILKAGAAYVAVDPAYPQSRIETILGVVGAGLVLVSPAQKGVCAGMDIETRVVDEAAIAALPAATEPRGCEPEDPVAIVFTSGTTGTPKGVVLTHANIATHITAHLPIYNLGAHSRWLQFATLTFDASFLEIFSPLSSGGCVCILADADRLNDLEGAINRLRVNVLFLTTTMASMLDPKRTPTIDTLFVGGEPVTEQVIAAWGGRNLHEIYGPSECTIFCHAYPNITPGVRPNNLGRPVVCTTYIVDPEDHDKLMPYGATGELVIAGPVLGRGYLHEQEKTTAAWIEHPGWAFPGCDQYWVPERIYKTGDLVSYDTEGNVLYGGRKDTQTKLRGQRLELAEIEVHLLKHPNVVQCAVFHPKSGPGKHRIAALVRFASPPGSSTNSDSGFGSAGSDNADDASSEADTLCGGDEVPVITGQGSDNFWKAVEDLETHLADLLPQFMIPNVWIGAEKLPMTFTGKVDRTGVTRWIEELTDSSYQRLVRSESSSDIAEAVTHGESVDIELELKMRAIWSEALNFPVERIPLDAPFFQLGGDSITAMQVVSRCSQADIPVSVQQVLQCKTISRLVENIHSSGALTQQRTKIVDNLELNTPFQLSPIQNMMFKLQPDGVNHHNQGFLVRLMKPITFGTLTSCIDRIVEAHPMLRARYEQRDGEWVQYITDEIRESYSFASHTISSLDDIEPIVQQRQRVFEVSGGPIFSADVFEGQEKQILLLNAHHLVIDLVSWRVILQDLEDLLKQGDSIKLTQGLSFQTWAKLQYENSKSARIEDILPFTPPPKLDLHEYWGLDVKNLWRDNAETSFRLSPQMTELFLRDANEPFDTAPMDILLTALSSSFLETFADRESLLVHPEGHGREAWDHSIDLSRTVGWFTVIYPLLMSQASDPLELLQHAKTIRKKSPGGGRPYFAAWHHSEHHREDDADFVSPIEILFNYHGGYQQLHRKEAIMQRVTEIDVEHTMNSPDLHRYALFEIEAAIEGEQLVVHVIYNQHIKRVPEVLRWVQSWEQHLLALLDNLASQVEVFQLQSPPTGSAEFSELENKMLSMWCTVLGMDKETAGITREQNFLNLGADNFDAMKLVSLARESGWMLDLEKILETPKLKDMVANMRLIEKGAKDYGEPPKPFALLGDEKQAAIEKQMICTRTAHRGYDIEDVYPSAPLQEALVALSILTPGSYTTDHVYHIPADLDITRFKAAWEATVAAHAVLRTQFTLGDQSRILQVVLQKQPLDWTEDTTRPLLEFAYNAPLTRYSLYDVGTPKAKFVWTIHHSLADGWAFELITADVASAYRHGTSTLLQTPRTPYSCFIHYLQSVNMEKSLDFWRSNLEGYIPADFPPVKSSPQERDHETADTKILTRTVRLSLGAKGFTGATLLRAAWALLLSRVANTDDVCFGATVTGRMVPIPGIETMVGPTIQTLPTRIRVDAEMPVLEFLEGIQKGYIETIPHEHVGLQNIARLGEAAKAACAAKTMLVVQPPPSNEESDEEVVMKKIKAVFDANYALALNCWQLKDSASIELSYDCLQVEESMASRILSQFECLLEEITDTLQQGSLSPPVLNDLNSFSEEDAKQLQQFNAHVETDLSEGNLKEQTVHAVIERNSRLHPDAPALDGWDGKLTYLELNMLSSRLASYLKSKNVGPETLVPVVFTKSIWFNVAALAVWKAGAAYVPIDPTQPLDRLSQMIATISTRAVVALSAPDQHDFTMELTHLQTITVTKDAILSLPAPSPPTPAPPTHPNSAAYVIFTSGSTGRPKGAVVEFGSLYASAKAGKVAMQIDPECRLLAFCSYIWDVHVIENFITLFAGGCVCVPSDQERTDNLVGALQRFSATGMTASPTICDLIDPAQVPSLKTLIAGGEPMTPRLIARLSPHLQLMNAYGPTEATILSNLNTTIIAGTSPKNIGFPVGSKSWIVDPANHNRILPVGSVGELALSGPCLARGYIDRHEETAKAFIDHPEWAERFQNQKIDRIYLTGDLARFNDNGSVEFFGRKDAQVKVNGIRIELGEIEHHVTSLASRACAVEAVPRGGSKLLVGFIQWDEATDGPFTTFKINADEELHHRVPSYMIPALWVPLPSLPMQQGSNKINRRELRGFFAGMKNAEMNRYACPTGQKKRVVNPPANQLEKRLRDLWATILDMNPEEVGRDDHFFRLQGDSVAAIRLVSEARRAGLQISTKQIFQNPVLADMAAVLEFVESELDEESLVPPFSMINAEVLDIALDEAAAHCQVEKEQIEDLMPCSPMQMGLIASSFAERGTYVVNHVSSLPADLDLARFKSSWEQAMAANAILRTRIIQSPSCNDDFLQVVMKDTSIPWEVIPRNEWDAYLERIIDQKHYSGSRLITLGLTTDRFVLNVHHALYDAGSLMGVFEHFAQGYRGEPLKPRAPYRNFVKYIHTLDPAESEALWRRELDGAAGTNFPVPENPNAPELEPVSAQIEQRIEFGETYSGIYTLGTMLRAAWALVISRHTRKEDICFRETLSGKTAPVVGIDNIAGPTICTVPFRVQLTDDITVGEYLDNVNSYATRIMGHEHIGIANISHLSPDCEAACQFRSLLVIQPDDSAQAHLGFGIEKVSAEMTQNIPLILEFVLLGDCVKLTARYDTNIIERSQVSCVLGHIENALKRLIAAEDNTKVTDVSLFGRYDEAWIAQLDNPTPPPGEDGYIAMLMRQVRETPEREAVCAHDGSFSYTELAEAVEALASHFIDAGITKGTTIALCFEKSKWVIVFMLATIRAGACYVSLDPGSPAARINLILNSCKPQYVFSAPHKVDLFEGLSFRVHPVSFDYMAGFIDTVVVNRERVIVEDRTSPIYMIFTSGSTGTPKGVVIPNAALADFSLRYKDAADITRDTRTLQFSAYTFDAAVIEIFVPLTVGGCICIPSEDDRTGDLAAAMERMRATWILLLPSVASVLEPADVPTLKTILLAGEGPTLNDCMRWYGKDVRNGYGPSECTCLSLLTRPGAISSGGSPSNLGYQTNCSVWIVNIHDRTQLAGVGEIGELVISGYSLALGYLGDKEKTDKAFYHAPWLQGRSTTRCYLTGDLARYAADGTIIFSGRKDNQIKLRGFRIELGEIEYHLIQQAEIARGVVILSDKGEHKQKLVAVFSLAGQDKKADSGAEFEFKVRKDVKTEVGKMQSALQGKLPSYMVPTMWVALEAVPVTVVGKIDRRAISSWLETYKSEEEQEEEGRIVEIVEEGDESATRKKLRKIWSEILDRPESKIKPDMSFFRMGGDSISAIRLVSRFKRENINITSKQIKKLKTIANIEEAIKEAGGFVEEEVVAKTVSYEPFELGPIQKMHFDLTTAGHPGFSQTTMLKVNGSRLDATAVARAVEGLVMHHTALRTTFLQDTAGNWKQKISQSATNAFRVTAHHSEALESLRDVAIQAQEEFDLRNGHVLNVCIFNIGEQKQYLLVSAHHLVIDFVSWKNVINDLDTLISSNGKEALAPVPVAYNEWTSAITQHAASLPPSPSTYERDLEILEYWGIDSADDNIYLHAAETSFSLTKSQTDAVSQYAVDSDTDFLTVLLATLAASFWKLFPEREEMGLFLESHGRDTALNLDLSRTVGWFTTFFPLFTGGKLKNRRTALAAFVDHFRSAREDMEDPHSYLASRYGPTWRSEKEPVPLEILFNHFGVIDSAMSADGSLLEMASDVEFNVIPKDMPRMALFEITTSVAGGCLNAAIQHHQDAENGERIAAWIKSWEAGLAGLGKAEEGTKEVDKVKKRQTVNEVAVGRGFKLLPRSQAEMTTLLDSALPEIGIKKEDVEDVYPCSPMQVGLILAQMRNPAEYNVDITWTLSSSSGPVDVNRLRDAWSKTIKRHSLLRTVFIEDPSGVDSFLQVVLRPDAHLPSPPAGQMVHPLGGHLAHRLLVEDSEPVRMTMECSHAIYDAYSNGILLGDLVKAYEGTLDDKPAPGYELFIDHLRNNSSEAADKKFWSEYLKDSEISHFPKLADETTGAELASLDWEVADSPDIVEFCRNNDTTPALFFKFIWSLVLRLYTGNDVVAFGSLVDGRDPDFAGVEGIVGPLINTLICKAGLQGGKKVVDAMMELQEASDDGSEHQRAGLAQVEGWVGLQGMHVFNTVMTFYMESVHSSTQDPEGDLKLEHTGGEDKSDYPVVLKVAKKQNEFFVQIDYHTTHLDAAHAEDLSRVMNSMIQQVVAHPGKTINEIQQHNNALYSATQKCCAVVHPNDDARLLPSGLRGMLVLQVPGMAGFTQTGQTARYDRSRSVSDVRALDEFCRVRGFEVDLSKVEQAFESIAGIKQFIAVPVGVARNIVKLAVYVCFEAEVPAGAAWDSMASELRTGAKARLPHGYQHLVTVDLLIPIGGCKGAMTRQAVLGAVTGQLADKTISVGDAAKVEEPEQAKVEEESSSVEVALREVFSKVLDSELRKVNKTTNFFEIGGDSLTAMQLVQQMKKRGFKISHGDVLRFPVLESMALKFTAIGSAKKEVVEEASDAEVKPFSMLKSTPKQLQQLAHPVEDAYPTTFFQQWSFNHSMSSNRGNLAHFIFDIPGALDKPRLEKACKVVVSRNEILRTVFLEDASIQAVFRADYVPEISFDRIVSDLEAATTTYIAQHGAIKAVGEPIVRFHILAAPQSHRLIMRITHAQFDGLSMLALMGELQHAYTSPQAPLPRKPTPASFIAASARTITPVAQKYWQQRLAGTSGMTSLSLPPSQRPHKMQHLIYVAPKLTNASFAHLNATFTTALKTAWASILAKHTGNNDVLFANLVSARTVDVENISDLITCAINFLPVRIAVPETAEPTSLLPSVQSDHAESMPYEAMDYSAICSAAGWAREGSALKTVVQHQNMQEVDEGDAGIGDVGARWSFKQNQPLPGGFEAWVVTAQREGGMEVGLGFDEAVMDNQTAKKLITALGECLEKMAGVSGGGIKEEEEETREVEEAREGEGVMEKVTEKVETLKNVVSNGIQQAATAQSNGVERPVQAQDAQEDTSAEVKRKGTQGAPKVRKDQKLRLWSRVSGWARK